MFTVVRPTKSSRYSLTLRQAFEAVGAGDLLVDENEDDPEAPGRCQGCGGGGTTR